MWLDPSAAGYTWTKLFDSGENRNASGKESQVSRTQTDWPFQRKETKVKDLITHWILQLRTILFPRMACKCHRLPFRREQEDDCEG